MRGNLVWMKGHLKTNLFIKNQDEGVLISLIVTSTCNRTEIYGFAQHPFQLIKLLIAKTVKEPLKIFRK